MHCCLTNPQDWWRLVEYHHTNPCFISTPDEILFGVYRFIQGSRGNEHLGKPFHALQPSCISRLIFYERALINATLTPGTLPDIQKRGPSSAVHMKRNYNPKSRDKSVKLKFKKSNNKDFLRLLWNFEASSSNKLPRERKSAEQNRCMLGSSPYSLLYLSTTV